MLGTVGFPDLDPSRSNTWK